MILGEARNFARDTRPGSNHKYFSKNFVGIFVLETRKKTRPKIVLSMACIAETSMQPDQKLRGLFSKILERTCSIRPCTVAVADRFKYNGLTSTSGTLLRSYKLKCSCGHSYIGHIQRRHPSISNYQTMPSPNICT